MYNKIIYNIPNFKPLISKISDDSARTITQCPKLKFLFSPSSMSSRSLRKEIGNLISALPLENKMLYQRGGQKVAYPRYNYEGFADYTVNRFVHSPKGYTNGLDDCIAVLLHNDEDAFLYHLAPGVHRSKIAIEDMQKGLSETIARLKEGNKKCSAVLVGGDDKKGSIPFYENISTVLKKHDIKAQEVLFGEGHKSIYYDIKKGVIVNDGMFFDVEDLKTEYKKVNISDTGLL